jgi:hypothetical protein
VNAAERSKLIREVELAGSCSHPIRLSGEMVNVTTGEVGMSSLRIACKDRRAVICPSCSYTYKADAWILVSSGLVGGKGTPTDVASHPRLFVTLTAPSFAPVHTVKTGGGCVSLYTPRDELLARGILCVHGRSHTCEQRHTLRDIELGRPLCCECFDYEGAVLWNAHASLLWNNTIQGIRRTLAETAGVNQKQLRNVAQVHYLKVAEMQRRGLVHLHIILRADGPGPLEDEPPSWLTSDLLAMVVKRSVSHASASGGRGERFVWGKRLDIQDLANGISDTTKVPSYVAKYATKTTDGTRDLARRFHSRRQIVAIVDDPHAQRLALTAWDLDLNPALESLHLRNHAHNFGFTGQLITKSRSYSTTFGALRQARAEYMSARNEGDPIEGTFRYEGRGYDDPRGTQLAEMFFAMKRELREESAVAKRMAPPTSPTSSL